MSFRGKDGKFSPGVNLTLGDLRRETIRKPGDHWIPLSTAPKRLYPTRVQGLGLLYPESARPALRPALWALQYGKRPGRLRRTCSERRCVNPNHHEEIMETSDAYRLYFSKALEAVADGEPFNLYFATEAEAIRQRANLSAYRKRAILEHNAPNTWSEISLSIRMLSGNDEDGVVEPTYALIAQWKSVRFQQALATALGVKNLDELPADLAPTDAKTLWEKG